jgi:hypothetical protein
LQGIGKSRLFFDTQALAQTLFTFRRGTFEVLITQSPSGEQAASSWHSLVCGNGPEVLRNRSAHA